jgi:hypothetical protein
MAVLQIFFNQVSFKQSFFGFHAAHQICLSVAHGWWLVAFIPKVILKKT